MQLLGNFTNVFVGKYHLTSPKNQHLPTTAIYSNSNRKYVFLTQISAQVFLVYLQKLCFSGKQAVSNPKTLLEHKDQVEMAACGAGAHPWLLLTATAPCEEEGGPGSPLLFQHTKIFLVWKTLTASKENIAPLPVHPNFGNLEFKFLFGTFFFPKGSIFGRHGSS